MSQSSNTKIVDICGASDHQLNDLIAELEKLKKKYGAKTIISFDAGYNNVEILIHPSKKQ